LAEKKIDITNLDQSQVFGHKNENLEIIKKGYSKLKFVLRGNNLKIIGDDKTIEDFSNLWDLIEKHYSSFNQLSQGTLKSMLDNKYVLDKIDFFIVSKWSECLSNEIT